ncbi:MAG: GNAT family N-acetyltransferase, partial [Desulfomonilia bacterium]|nr:GNAT family N-acetyltransferase [Desulfomonilia bacterium]
VEFLIARCPSHDLETVQQMERHGFLLMDTLVYYTCRLKNKPFGNALSSQDVRPIKSGEENSVKNIAASSFKGYQGHYHADSRLEKKKCDEVYIDWAYTSCSKETLAHEVLVKEREGEIVGFATMRMNNSAEGEGVLFGVAPSFQGKGIYRSLMIGGMKWCVENNMDRMVVSTQVNNIAVQKVWVRLGFEPSRSYYTFHKWFSPVDDDGTTRP